MQHARENEKCCNPHKYSNTANFAVIPHQPVEKVFWKSSERGVHSARLPSEGGKFSLCRSSSLQLFVADHIGRLMI